jgi:type II secretory pathway pseudopilin PulG
MFEDWIVVICGIVVIIIVAAVALLQLRSSERRMHENTHKLRVYTDLLNAITELNLAGGDPYKMDIAKKNLAMTLNRLNLVGSTGVLKSTNDLLDFLNEHKDKEFDTLRLHNILNTLVIEARRDLNPSHARKVEEAQVRYRFFAPPRNK